MVKSNKSNTTAVTPNKGGPSNKIAPAATKHQSKKKKNASSESTTTRKESIRPVLAAGKMRTPVISAPNKKKNKATPVSLKLPLNGCIFPLRRRRMQL